MYQYIVSCIVLGSPKTVKVFVLARDEYEASWIAKNKVRTQGGEL